MSEEASFNPLIFKAYLEHLVQEHLAEFLNLYRAIFARPDYQDYLEVCGITVSGWIDDTGIMNHSQSIELAFGYKVMFKYTDGAGGPHVWTFIPGAWIDDLRQLAAAIRVKKEVDEKEASRQREAEQAQELARLYFDYCSGGNPPLDFTGIYPPGTEVVMDNYPYIVRSYNFATKTYIVANTWEGEEFRVSADSITPRD